MDYLKVNDTSDLDRAFPYLLVRYDGIAKGWHIEAWDSMESLVSAILASPTPCFPALLMELQAVPCEGE